MRVSDRAPGLVLGVILILVGVVFFVREWFPAVDFDLFWPIALVVLGVVVLVVGFSRGSDDGAAPS